MIDRSLKLTALAALAAGLLVIAPPARAAAPSATTYYEAAIAAMQRLPEPRAAIFTTQFHSNALAYFLTTTKGGYTILEVEWGGNVAALGNERYRTWMRARSDRTLNVDAKGKHYYSTSPVYVPTWPGAYDFLRYGWGGKGSPNKTVHPTVPPPPGLKTIAVVSAISPGAYHIADRGAALCPDGSAGHALHLTALYDPAIHTLSRVIIDAKTMRICSLRFNIHESMVAVALGGYVQMNFGEVGDYWMVRTSKIEMAIHALGIQVKHGSATIAYSAMTFPPSIPRSLVTPPSPSPSPRASPRASPTASP